MKKPISASERLLRSEQPINWGRAFVTGMLGASLMMSWVDIFAMMGYTPFSFEVYLGSLIRDTATGTNNWVPGFFANLITGGIFGIFYGYLFEYVFKRADARTGTLLGACHAIFAAVAVFPFFNTIHEQMDLDLYPNGFGLLGSSLSLPTPALLIIGHLLFGATVGTLYGPVQLRRIHLRDFEPGETGDVWDPDVVSAEEDPEDRAAV